jgi:HK97 family phage portal protein
VRVEAFGYGFEVRLGKAGAPLMRPPAARGSGGWVPIIREPYTGAWQRNDELTRQSILNYAPVFACVRLIATDVAKMRCRLVERHSSGVWQETESASFSPFLRKPNRYSTRLKFFEQWMISKLLHGNTYALVQRDARGVVVAAYILEPTRVKVLVAVDGSVWYQLQTDHLAGTPATVTVPASEIMHDLYLPLYHPLIGVTPITACGLAALEALAIQGNSSAFFANGSQPGGVISAPGPMDLPTLGRVRDEWNKGFTGENVGKVAVLSDGMKYDQLTVNAVDSQLIEQLQWTAGDVCQAFGVPPFKINAGPAPTLAGGFEALNLQYYSQCLQELIENVEETVDIGLGLAPWSIDGKRLGVEFNRGDLLQMDTAARVEAATKTVTAGVLSPNEARVAFMDAVPVAGGGSPMMQQQQFSLEALAARDADDPFSKPTPAPAAAAPPALEPDDELVAAQVATLLRSALELEAVA